MARRNKYARTTMDMAELALLVPVVVAQRTARVARARNARTNAREAQRMVTEKVNAATESIFAIAMSAGRAHMQWASLWARAAGMPATASMAALMRSASADASAKAIAPYLRRARSNARRLAR